jgi:hypothetical protein
VTLPCRVTPQAADFWNIEVPALTLVWQYCQSHTTTACGSPVRRAAEVSYFTSPITLSGILPHPH